MLLLKRSKDKNYLKWVRNSYHPFCLDDFGGSNQIHLFLLQLDRLLLDLSFFTSSDPQSCYVQINEVPSLVIIE